MCMCVYVSVYICMRTCVCEGMMVLGSERVCVCVCVCLYVYVCVRVRVKE